MDQDDIFRLLLIVLLLANRQLAGDNRKNTGTNTDATNNSLSLIDEDDDGFNYTMINDLLILVMATQLFANPDNDSSTNIDTTF